MFGFGQRSAPDELLKRVIQGANEACSGIAGLVENNQLIFREFKISLSEDGSRKRLASELKERSSELSRNPDNWPNDMARLAPSVSASP
jgi:hypothetical protein